MSRDLRGGETSGRVRRLVMVLSIAAAAVLGHVDGASGGIRIKEPAKPPPPVDVESLFLIPRHEFSAPRTEAGACRRQREAPVHVLLIGADEYPIGGGRTFQTSGVLNDISLLAETLQSIGVPGERITRIVGKEATRPRLLAALQHLIEQAQCGDTAFIHFSGGGTELPDSPAKTDRRRLAMLLWKDPGADAKEDRISDFAALFDIELEAAVAAIRNRGTFVFLSVDTDFAGSLKLARFPLQRPWRWETEPVLPDAANDDLARLAPRAAGFTGFYAGAGPVVETRLPRGVQTAKTYGLFSFALAAVLNGSPDGSSRELAEGIEAIFRDFMKDEGIDTIFKDFVKAGGRSSGQHPIFESTHPHQVPFGASTGTPPEKRKTSIEILTPRLTRGFSTVPASDLKVSGIARPADGLIEVYVNGGLARLDDDGRFSAEVKLVPGPNPVTAIGLWEGIGPGSGPSLAHHGFQVFRGASARTSDAKGVSYALVIGNADYEDPAFPDLVTPAGDAKAVAEVLRRDFGFRTSLAVGDGKSIELFLENAGQRRILGTLSRLRRRLEPEDRLLIFYAGHGWRSEERDVAYWIPVDAPLDEYYTYIPAGGITEELRAMRARHVLVISDSCYSGALSRAAAGGPGAGRGEARRERYLA